MRQLTPKELKNFKKSQFPRDKEIVILLENIESTEVLKEISQIANAAGVKRIYLTGTSKSFSQATNLLEVILEKNSFYVIQNLKRQGFITIAIEMTTQSLGLDELKKLGQGNDKICLVFGNDITGLSNDTLKNCDEAVFIPTYGKNSSLKLEVRVGIALYGV